MDPVARYNRLREAQRTLAQVEVALSELGLKDTGLMTHLAYAINELTAEIAKAHLATLPKMRESKTQ